MIKGIIAATILALVQAIRLVTARYLTKKFNPIFINWIAWLLAVCILLLKSKIGSFSRLKVGLSTMFRLMIIGLLGSSYGLLVIFGLSFSPASQGAVILRLDILITAILGHIFLKEKVHLADIPSAILMIWGSLKVMGMSLLTLSFNQLADLIFVFAVFFVSINAILIKVLLQDVHRDAIAFYNIAFSLLFSTLYLIGLHGLSGFSSVLKVGASWTYFLILGVVTSCMYIIYYYALERIPAWQVRVLTLSTPIFVAILGVYFLQEKFGFSQLLGTGAVILGGILLVYNPKRRISNHSKL